MSIKSDVRNALIEIASDLEQGTYRNEEQVIQGVVMHILNALGWTIHKTKEVTREFPVGKRRVDIALCHNSRPRVFIEVKSVGKINPDSVEQAFFYAYHEGVPLLILSDGQNWIFYDARAEGQPADKMFHKLDIKNMPADECADFFYDFLSREEVASNRAADKAREVIKHKKQEVIEQSIAEAWETLLKESSDLRNLIRDKTEQECGHRPSDEMIDNFLSAKAQKSQRIEQEEQSFPTIKKNVKNSEASVHRPNNSAESLIGLSIQGFLYKGEYYKTDSGRDMLSKALVLFHEEDKSFLKRFSAEHPNLANKQRYAIAPHQPKEKVKIWTDLLPIKGEEWYVKGNHGNNSLRSVLQKACEAMRIVYGKDFEILAKPKA